MATIFATFLGVVAAQEFKFQTSIGDVRSDSAVLWISSNAYAKVLVLMDGKAYNDVELMDERDYATTLALSGLQPANKYGYKVYAHNVSDLNWVAGGSFTTAPREEEAQPLAFAFGGDVGGQNVCRGKPNGYEIFGKILEHKDLKFFIGLGDMTYTDSECREIGRYGQVQEVKNLSLSATPSRQDFWDSWRYNFEDEVSCWK